MNKQIITVLASLGLILSSTVAFAGSFNVGVAGAIAHIEADGSETTTAGDNGAANATINTATVDNDNVFIGSIFAEYEMDGGLAIGLEHIPGSADVSDKTKSRTETDKSITGQVATQTTSVKRSAQAEIENYMGVYVEVPVMGSPLFVRAGMSEMDVNTLEI